MDDDETPRFVIIGSGFSNGEPILPMHGPMGPLSDGTYISFKPLGNSEVAFETPQSVFEEPRPVPFSFSEEPRFVTIGAEPLPAPTAAGRAEARARSAFERRFARSRRLQEAYERGGDEGLKFMQRLRENPNVSHVLREFTDPPEGGSGGI